jgi:hypothetical protein
MKNNSIHKVEMKSRVLRQRRSHLAVITIMFLLTVLVLPGYAVGTGDISGTVTDSNSLLQEVDVFIYNADGFQIEYTVTNEQGKYNVAYLPVGDYKVQFSKTGYIEQWYNNAPFAACAEPVTVTDGGNAIADAVLVQGTNNKLQKRIALAQDAANSINISGSVTLNGKIFKCAQVEAYSTTDSSEWVDQVYTDYQGNYTFSSLPSGSYKILFYDQNDNPAQWYSNTAGFSCAASVSETASGVNAAFPIGNLQQCTTLVPIIKLLLN